MFTAWLNPRIEPLMKLYVFNITNPQQVRGQPFSKTWQDSLITIRGVRRLWPRDGGAGTIRVQVKPYSAGDKGDQSHILRVDLTCHSTVASLARGWRDSHIQEQEILHICTRIISRWVSPGWTTGSLTMWRGSESDPLTVLNMILVTAANKFRDLPDFVR